jgi:hypothetical protein
MAPTDQLKVLAVVAVNTILVAVPLQIDAVFGAVTTGVGLTVTVIVYCGPGHAGLVVETGEIIYSTVPAEALPGLVNV